MKTLIEKLKALRLFFVRHSSSISNRDETNCQSCKIYGMCPYHKWLFDSMKCKNKVI